jgi:hypothetical protein
VYYEVSVCVYIAWKGERGLIGCVLYVAACACYDSCMHVFSFPKFISAN